MPESALDDSLHLVMWGHEHEQRIVPEPVAEKSYKISQPGSTIATSLSPGETIEKSVALVEVTGQSYHLQPIPLRTVRPFLYKTLSLPAEAASAMIDPSDRVAVTKLLRNKVRSCTHTRLKTCSKRLSANGTLQRGPWSVLSRSCAFVYRTIHRYPWET